MTEPGPHPKLSVVIPTLGRSTLLPTLESLLSTAGLESVEIIVAGKISDPTVSQAFKKMKEAHAFIRHLEVAFEKGDSSEKKNAGWRAAKADLVAFLDDDVVVAPDWPVQMQSAFDDPETALVSGPGLVPPDIPLFPRLAGLALSSPAAGYVAWRYRHQSDPLIPINWSKIIGCNMAYRRSVLEAIGGFDAAFWPGEEMIAAFITEQKGYRLMFCSSAWVYHYPRQSILRFIKQIYGYGATRIRLIRGGVQFEATTLVPALWVGTLIVGAIASLFNPWFLLLLGGAWAAHFLVTLVITAMMVRESGQWKDVGLIGVIPMMHLSYGWAGWVELFCPNRDLSLRLQDKN